MEMGGVGGRCKVIALKRLYAFLEFRDVGREDCVCSEDDHPKNFISIKMFSMEEQKSQTEDRFFRGRQIVHDLRLLLGNWRS